MNLDLLRESVSVLLTGFLYLSGNLAHAAVRIRSLQILNDIIRHPKKFLLLDKADEKFGRTPLHEAVFMLTEGQSFIQQSIEENKGQEYGNDELAAIANVKSKSYINDLEIVKFLVNFNCNVNAVDRKNRTPLHDAAKAGNHDITMILLNHNAQKYIEDVNGLLPWMEAVKNGFEKLADLLLLEEDLYRRIEKSKRSENHMFAAVAAKCVRCVQYLIKRGVNAGDHRLVSREGVTPLIKALQLRDPHIASLLVRFSGQLVNLKTSTGYSAVNYALDAWSSKQEVAWERILTDLVKLGADIQMYVGVHNVHILMQRDYLVNVWKLDWILSLNPDLNVQYVY